MQNCPQMKERKCGKGILKCANAKDRDYNMLFWLSLVYQPYEPTIRLRLLAQGLMILWTLLLL